MPRFLSLVMTRAALISPTGASQMLSTPSLGAIQDSQRPSGEIWACARVGLPNSLARGMSGSVADGVMARCPFLHLRVIWPGYSGADMTLLWANPMFRGCASLAIASLLVLFAGNPLMAFDLQGHRGARGLAPENTLAAFARAL